MIPTAKGKDGQRVVDPVVELLEGAIVTVLVDDDAGDEHLELTAEATGLISAEIYTENRVQEYRIMDLAPRSVFVHTEPAHGRHRSVIRLPRKDVLRQVYLPRSS